MYRYVQENWKYVTVSQKYKYNSRTSIEVNFIQNNIKVYYFKYRITRRKISYWFNLAILFQLFSACIYMYVHFDLHIYVKI